jgi:hypothetical protein
MLGVTKEEVKPFLEHVQKSPNCVAETGTPDPFSSHEPSIVLFVTCSQEYEILYGIKHGGGKARR